jgi:hypothetical protein
LKAKVSLTLKISYKSKIKPRKVEIVIYVGCPMDFTSQKTRTCSVNYSGVAV